MVEGRTNPEYSFRQENMRREIRQIALVNCAGLMVLVLAGCGDNSSGAAKQPAAKIQGELIAPAANAAIQPKESLAAVGFLTQTVPADTDSARDGCAES